MLKAVAATAVLTCAFLADAQVTASVSERSDGSTEIRIRNTSTVRLTAFAISVKFAIGQRPHDTPLTVFSDTIVDDASSDTNRRPSATSSLQAGPIEPKESATWLPRTMLAGARSSERPVFQEPVIAAVFANGSSAGNPLLLRRLLVRRSSMLLALETAIETISDAGARNVPKEQLIRQFRTMASSMTRWYVPAEQQVGRDVYQAMVEKLSALPEPALGAAFPPSSFVAEQTAVLHRRRVLLLESHPSLADLESIGLP